MRLCVAGPEFGPGLELFGDAIACQDPDTIRRADWQSHKISSPTCVSQVSPGLKTRQVCAHNHPMDKDRVAEILVEIGTLLELKRENPFKTRAYANAARALENLSEPLAKIVAEDRLGEIKGIGEGIARKIKELVETDRLGYYDELKASIPAGLAEMLEIP